MNEQSDMLQKSLSNSIVFHSQSNLDLNSVQDYIENIENDLMKRVKSLSQNLNKKRNHIKILKKKVTPSSYISHPVVFTDHDLCTQFVASCTS